MLKRKGPAAANSEALKLIFDDSNNVKNRAPRRKRKRLRSSPEVGLVAAMHSPRCVAALDPSSPRLRPTLPRLKCLERALDDGGEL
jgi:hypothetical protein